MVKELAPAHTVTWASQCAPELGSFGMVA